jgi:hypothetical protein
MSRQTDESGGMDDLTDGMKAVSIKSIKLKMPTEERHAANQKKREEEQRPKQAKPARKPPVPKANKVKVPLKTVEVSANELQPEAVADQVMVDPGVSIKQEQASTAMHTESMKEPSTAETSLAQGSAGVLSAIDFSATQEQGSGVKYPMAPPSVPQPQDHDELDAKVNPDGDRIDMSSADAVSMHAHSQSQATPAPSQWTFTTPIPPPPQAGSIARPMTPNRKTKADLPVFTSTSPIPFSKTSNTASDDDGKHGHEGRSIWDLPETPR